VNINQEITGESFPTLTTERELAAFNAAQYRQFYGRGDYRYAIYPDNWKDTWGKPPLLGIISADNEFLAERLAYDKGVLNPYNCTFQPRIKNIGPNKKM
jgi:hypothetical protein